MFAPRLDINPACKEKNVSNFSTNLKTLVKKHEISQRTLARESGLSEATISYYLSEKRSPKAYHLIAIAQYFSVDCVQLAQGEINE